MALPEYLTREAVEELIAQVRAEERAEADRRVAETVREGQAIIARLRRKLAKAEATRQQMTLEQARKFVDAAHDRAIARRLFR